MVRGWDYSVYGKRLNNKVGRVETLPFLFTTVCFFQLKFTPSFSPIRAVFVPLEANRLGSVNKGEATDECASGCMAWKFAFPLWYATHTLVWFERSGSGIRRMRMRKCQVGGDGGHVSGDWLEIFMSIPTSHPMNPSHKHQHTRFTYRCAAWYGSVNIEQVHSIHQTFASNVIYTVAISKCCYSMFPV